MKKFFWLALTITLFYGEFFWAKKCFEWPWDGWIGLPTFVIGFILITAGMVQSFCNFGKDFE